MAKKKKSGFFDRLKHKYKLIIFKDDTFEEVWSQNLSRFNLIALIGGLSIAMTVLIFVLIAYTPVRHLVPGYPDDEMTANIRLNALKLDSLENQIRIKDQYFENIRRIIFGEIQADSEYVKPVDTTLNYSNLSFQKSPEDSILRKHVEEQDMYNLKVFSSKPVSSSGRISDIVFFPPIKGIITNKFNKAEKHYGVDIVAAPNETILATLDGTVTLSSYTTEAGYVIYIQHPNNMVSVYKHLSTRLKSQGNTVRAGEGIAIIGNSGEYTSGPHLHFEIWHNGKALNPEDYIVFN